MKEERYLKDREAIVRADIWKEITSSCKGLRTELGYTNIQIVEFLKEITKTFERDQLWIMQVEIYFFLLKDNHSVASKASSIFLIELLKEYEVNVKYSKR